MKNVINSVISAGAFKSGNVLRGFDNTYRLFITSFVTAYRALFGIGEVLTYIAAMHTFACFEYMRCEKFYLFYRLIKHKISKTLCCLHSYAGKLRKLFCRRNKRYGVIFSHIRKDPGSLHRR